MSTAASPHPSDHRFAVVVMGVSGSGKTTSGVALAKAAGVPFFDGDDLHTPETRAKMASGVPLTDADRTPWLDRVGGVLADAIAHPKGAVVACSALRRIYRDQLRGAVGPNLRFLYLHGSQELMHERVAERKGHYMPASLVASQFATLEDPSGEPDVVTMEANADLDQAIPDAIACLGKPANQARRV
jgi:gluconokinase